MGSVGGWVFVVDVTRGEGGKLDYWVPTISILAVAP